MSDIVNAAHNDGQNQAYSIIGVIGTLGTADVKGTANTLPIGVNPDTGAMYVDVMDTTFNVGTLTVGTINKVGTVGEITNGTIRVTAGTVAVNTLGTIASGSIAVTSGTGIITSGSIAVTAATITAGTMQLSGTPNVNVISGSLIVTTGTVNAGTVDVLKAGTITSGSIVVTAGTITSGSITMTGGTITGGTMGMKYIDTGGTVHGFIDNGGAPQICSQDYLQALAEGDIAGHTAWSKVGFTGTMTTTESDIWSKGGKYPFLSGTVGTAMRVSSSNALDAIGSAGCNTVKISYLDRNYATAVETVNLGGTAYATTSATDIYRVNSFRVETAGGSACAVGNITLENATGGTTYGYITKGYTRGRNSAYTVPAGKSLYLTSIGYGYGCAANQVNYARLILRASQNDGVKTSGIFHPLSEVIAANAEVVAKFDLPIKVVEKVDMIVSGSATAAGIADVVVRGWLE